jgi:hypothetical protein
VAVPKQGVDGHHPVQLAGCFERGPLGEVSHQRDPKGLPFLLRHPSHT